MQRNEQRRKYDERVRSTGNRSRPWAVLEGPVVMVGVEKDATGSGQGMDNVQGQRVACFCGPLSRQVGRG